jgi:prephenate dehydratase
MFLLVKTASDPVMHHAAQHILKQILQICAAKPSLHQMENTIDKLAPEVKMLFMKKTSYAMFTCVAEC